MIKLIHVRGTIAPTSNAKTANLSKLAKALENAKLTEFTGLREISEKGRITFDRTYTYTSLSPNIAELGLRFHKFIQSKEVKGLSMYGTLMVIMETNDDFPKLYRITLEQGAVTIKEASVTWNTKAA